MLRLGFSELVRCSRLVSPVNASHLEFRHQPIGFGGSIFSLNFLVASSGYFKYAGIYGQCRPLTRGLRLYTYSRSAIWVGSAISNCLTLNKFARQIGSACSPPVLERFLLVHSQTFTNAMFRNCSSFVCNQKSYEALEDISYQHRTRTAI